MKFLSILALLLFQALGVAGESVYAAGEPSDSWCRDKVAQLERELIECRAPGRQPRSALSLKEQTRQVTARYKVPASQLAAASTWRGTFIRDRVLSAVREVNGKQQIVKDVQNLSCVEADPNTIQCSAMLIISQFKIPVPLKEEPISPTSDGHDEKD